MSKRSDDDLRAPPLRSLGKLPSIQYEEDLEARETTSVQVLAEATIPAPAPVRVVTPALVVLEGNGAGTVHLLRDGAIIGRALGVEVQIEEEGVSRRHARVEVSPAGQVEIVDLQSRNGVFIRNNRVTRAIWREGDRLRLGASTVCLLYLDASAASVGHRANETVTIERKAFVEALGRELAVANSSPVTLFLFHIDNHNRICDEHGFAAGELLTQRLSVLIEEIVNPEGRVVARYGEGEVALFVPEVSDEEAYACGEWVRRAAATSAFVIPGARVVIGISGGLARSVRGDTAPRFLDRADRALCRARAEGGDCIRSAEEQRS